MSGKSTSGRTRIKTIKPIRAMSRTEESGLKRNRHIVRSRPGFRYFGTRGKPTRDQVTVVWTPRVASVKDFRHRDQVKCKGQSASDYPQDAIRSSLIWLIG